MASIASATLSVVAAAEGEGEHGVERQAVVGEVPEPAVVGEDAVVGIELRGEPREAGGGLRGGAAAPGTRRGRGPRR